MRVLGDLLQHQLQRFRQVTQALELGFVGIQLVLVRQFASQQKVSHLFELGVIRQVGNIVSAVGQAGTSFANGAQGGFTSYLATQASATEFLCFSHVGLPDFLFIFCSV